MTIVWSLILLFDKSFRKPVTNSNSCTQGLSLRSIGKVWDKRHNKEVSTNLTYNMKQNLFLNQSAVYLLCYALPVDIVCICDPCDMMV